MRPEAAHIGVLALSAALPGFASFPCLLMRVLAPHSVILQETFWPDRRSLSPLSVGDVDNTSPHVVILSNMGAEPLLHERLVIAEGAFVELVVWRVRSPLRGSLHTFKYRLALVEKGVCVLRYDNEAGKGDHKHLHGEESPYAFTTPAQLLADVWNDVDHWRSR